MDDFRPRRWPMIVGGIAFVALLVFAVRGGARDAWNRASGTVEYVTGVGERRTVQLEDGSRIELSVTSTLRHPRHFPADGRPVTLIGEAFFTVTNDATRPFVVTAGPAAAETGGARFGVRAYPGANAAMVVVDSGIVGVRPEQIAPAPTTPILTGNLARVARDGAINRSDSVDLPSHFGWRNGRIVLDDVPLRQALEELARWQTIDVGIGDSVVANRRVTATFASHQTLTEMLDGIALQAGARYERSGRTVIFRLER